ncbi:hypothetical protein HKX48_001766 [Thoreauomyces humboldtii]|nr:hypothetical protein HKX48_001766 [Thoreauomyces humboldtii]
MAYGNAKGIATWYIDKRKKDKENLDLMDLPVADACKIKRLEDEKRREDQKKERKRKAEEAEEADELPKKKRSKRLVTSAEEKALWEEKAKRRAEEPLNAAGENEPKTLQITKEAKNKEEKSIRAMAFRFYPSQALATGLSGWLDVADAIDGHVKEVLESFAAKGEKASFRFVREEHICLSLKKYQQMEAEGTLGQLRDLDRRRAYTSLPFDVQQAVIKESVANFTTNQTNLEKGNNNGFETRPREASRRWKTLKFLATGMCVNRKTGEVVMYPQSNFVEKGCDRGMYIKDRLISFLCDSRTTEPGTTELQHLTHAPTKHWGNHLQCGKDVLFAGPAARGNMCSIDPGARTPWTCFDAHRKGFYDVYPDLVGTLANHHNDIAGIQSAGAPRTRKEGTRCRRKRRKKKRQAKGSRGQKKKRNWRPSCQRRVTDKYDLMKAMRRKQLKLPGMKEVDNMNTTPREGRFKLHKTTRKAMGWISHYAFRQRLFAKALADPYNVKDVICTTEEYTTKQFPFCDFVHHKIGSNKVYKCGNAGCGFIGRRDNVGAFNIGLRSIVKGEVEVL